MADTETKVVIGDGKKSRQPRLHPKKPTKIATIIVLIVLAAGLAAGFYWYKDRSDSSDQSATTPEQTTTDTDLGKVNTLAGKGDYAGAQKLLDEQLDVATNNTAKADIYNQKAALYVADKQYDLATVANQEAANFSSSVTNYELAGDTALAQGNKVLAQSNYQKAIDELNKDAPNYPSQLNKLSTKLESAK